MHGLFSRFLAVRTLVTVQVYHWQRASLFHLLLVLVPELSCHWQVSVHLEWVNGINPTLGILFSHSSNIRYRNIEQNRKKNTEFNKHLHRHKIGIYIYTLKHAGLFLPCKMDCFYPAFCCLYQKLSTILLFLLSFFVFTLYFVSFTQHFIVFTHYFVGFTHCFPPFCCFYTHLTGLN